jgi:dihydrofolate reductase
MNVNLIAAISLNGLIAHDKHDPINWTSPEDKRMFADVTKKAGAVVMGNTTFKTLSQPLPNRLTVVMTRQPQESSTPLVEYTSSSPKEIITALEMRDFDTVFIAGGSSVYSQYLTAGLVNEIWLTINPIVFAKGIPLFNAEIPSTSFHLVEHRLITADSLFLRYALTIEAHQSDTL